MGINGDRPKKRNGTDELQRDRTQEEFNNLVRDIARVVNETRNLSVEIARQQHETERARLEKEKCVEVQREITLQQQEITRRQQFQQREITRRQNLSLLLKGVDDPDKRMEIFREFTRISNSIYQPVTDTPAAQCLVPFSDTL
jgi:hypothetical protein